MLPDGLTLWFPAEELVTSLSRVSWEKVDVSFQGSRLRFAAHSVIQVCVSFSLQSCCHIRLSVILLQATLRRCAWKVSHTMNTCGYNYANSCWEHIFLRAQMIYPPSSYPLCRFFFFFFWVRGLCFQRRRGHGYIFWCFCLKIKLDLKYRLGSVDNSSEPLNASLIPDHSAACSVYCDWLQVKDQHMRAEGADVIQHMIDHFIVWKWASLCYFNIDQATVDSETLISALNCGLPSDFKHCWSFTS